MATSGDIHRTLVEETVLNCYALMTDGSLNLDTGNLGGKLVTANYLTENDLSRLRKKPENEIELFISEHVRTKTDSSQWKILLENIIASGQSIGGIMQGEYERQKRELSDSLSVGASSGFGQGSINSNFDVIGQVHMYTKYFQRLDVEQRILQNMKAVALNPRNGIFLITGEGGVGKSTLMAKLLYDEDNKQFFVKECHINLAIWINCFEWRNIFDEKAFGEAFVALVKKVEPDLADLDVKTALLYFNRKNMRCAFVFDDMYNYQLIRWFCNQSGGNSPPVCFALTRDTHTIEECDQRTIGIHDKLEKLSDDSVKDMWIETYKLDEHFLSVDQLLELAPFSCGLPLIVDLIAARIIQQGSSSEEVKVVIEALTRKLNDELIDLPTRDERLLQTVSAILLFNFVEMDKKLQYRYFAFLLFNPAEPVSRFDLAILWGFDNGSLRDLHIECKKLEQRSLLRRVNQNISKKRIVQPVSQSLIRRGLSAIKNFVYNAMGWQEGEEGINSDDNSAQPSSDGEDLFLVHQLLFDCVLQRASVEFGMETKLKPDEKLEQLRVKIISGEFQVNDQGAENSELTVLVNAFKSRRIFLLNQIIEHLAVEDLAKFCRKKDSLTKGCPFLLFVFREKDGEDASDIDFRVIVNVLTKILAKIQKEKPDLTWEVFSEHGPGVSQGSRHSIPSYLYDDIMESGRLFSATLRKTLDYWKEKYESYQKELTLQSLSESDDFVKAALEENLNEINRMLNSDNEITEERKYNALLVACEKGFLDVVKAIFGNDSNVMTYAILCPAVAVSNGHLNILKFLTKNSPAQVKLGLPITIFMACKYGQFGCIEYLNETFHGCLRGKCFGEIYGDLGETSLMTAALTGQIEVCKFIIKCHPDIVDAVDNNGRGYWTYAVWSGNLDMVKYAADLNKSNHDRIRDMFEVACTNGDLEIMKYLIERFGETVDFDFSYGFGSAATSDQTDIIEYLYDKVDEPFLFVTLGMATDYGYDETVSFLMSKNPELAGKKSAKGQTAVDLAKKKGLDHILRIFNAYGYK